MRATLILTLALLTAPLAARAEIIDRIAAVVDGQVITLTELNQIVELGLITRLEGESDAAYRRRVLDLMITHLIRYRDVERFGAADVPADSIEAAYQRIIARYPSEAAFLEALARVELTPDQVRTLIKRYQQVQRSIDERFAPLIFVSLEEIEAHYRNVWAPDRRRQGLPVPDLASVREEIRTALRGDRLKREVEVWTQQLRSRSNIDVFVY
ncbi:MAG TPA: hypothetical protein VFV54_03160 [Thermoanaerobaculia bacterium]|nr:hypothetical protein [Thermoanaerobaculia bacterium]